MVKSCPADGLQSHCQRGNSKPAICCLAAQSPPLYPMDALQVQVMPIFELGTGSGHPCPAGVPHHH